MAGATSAKFNAAAAPPVKYCDWGNGQVAPADSWTWVECAQSEPTADNIKNALVAVGFNDASVKRLMEDNPRLALMAAEAKYSYDNDPRHAVYDEKGNDIGHKSFQLRFRDGSGAETAAGAGTDPQNAESRRQTGQALDFWVMEPVRQKDGSVKMVESGDGARRYPGVWMEQGGGRVHVRDEDRKTGYEDFQHVAWHFTHIGKRDYGIASGLQGDGAERKQDSKFEPDTRMRIYQPGGGNGEGYDWGHIQLPDRFDREWERDPKTGEVWMDPRGQNWQRGANGQIWLNEGPNAHVTRNGVLQPNSQFDLQPKFHAPPGVEAEQEPPKDWPKLKAEGPSPPKPGQGRTTAS